MDFLELAMARYSVRSFNPEKEVEQEKVDRILKAGQVAPTAVNFQPQKIYLIRGNAALEKYRKCTPCHFGETLVLITCYDKTRCWTRPDDGKQSGDIDGSIVTTHMMLEAWELGIGSTWIMKFDPAAVRREFNLPDELEPVSVLSMGYPAEDAAPSPRHTLYKPIEELVTEA